jgi:hypothetical protein
MVVDTSTLQQVAEVPLPAPAFDAAPLSDGRKLISSNTPLTPELNQWPTHLVDVPSGSELASWPGALAGIGVWQAAIPAQQGMQAASSGSVTGHVMLGYGDRSPVAGEWVQLSNMSNDPTGQRKLVQTAADGGFRVDGVPPGQQGLLVPLRTCSALTSRRRTATVAECNPRPMIYSTTKERSTSAPRWGS